MSAPRRQVVNQPFGARPLSGGSSLRHSLQITRVMSSAPWSNLYRVGPRQLVFAGGTRHGVRVVDNRRRAHPAPAGGLFVGAVAGRIAPAPMREIGSCGLALIGQDDWTIRRWNGPASQATRSTDIHGARFHLIATR